MALVHAKLTHPDYGFTMTDQQGHSFLMDIPQDQGGGGGGFRPMQTLLAALCGCSAVDVVSILKKQRQSYESLEIKVDGEREKGDDLAVWKEIELAFILTGPVDPSKAIRAVSLSIEKYCSVAETLRRAGAEISFTVTVNGNLVNA
jgi:putative redox protein